MLARIAGLALPVLCLDTCTVLDAMRDPTREQVKPHEREAGLSLLLAAEGGTALVALAADQVRLEFGGNIDLVEAEASRSLARLREQLGRIEGIAAVYGARGTADLAHLDDHVPRARRVAERWMAAAIEVERSPEVAARAFARLNAARAPARKGKDSMKDCVVVETYMEVAAKLRAAGLSSPIVFASSNTADFTDGPGSRPRAELVDDFAAARIEYAPNLGAARHLLGL
ncbi:hypothetical protein VQH23_13810 [Pararoseomonas sp. SCSIO 73927]|uniref:hypothetical protein n=1 Tax=Pararoseomonas sp. SCSIO 73927 TaxID=3114537 RepID=UPI0030CF5284